MTLGSKIQKLRKSKSLSQEAFADIFHVSRQSVSKWELDQTYPEINKLIEIADYFNITLDELVRDIPKEANQNQNIADQQISQGIPYGKINEVHDSSTNGRKNVTSIYVKIFLFVMLFLFIFYYGYVNSNYTMLIAYVSSASVGIVCRKLIVKFKANN